MKTSITIFLLVVCVSCKNSEVATKAHSLLGTWLLIDHNRLNDEFWSKENDVPLGFRFYSKDSAEVYRLDYFYPLDRFTPYKLGNDTLKVLKSDSLGWWKRHASLKGDTLTIYNGADTIIYQRLFGNELGKPKKFERMVLARSSSWSDLLSVVLYPNGKTVVYLRPRGSVADKFLIKHTPQLFSKLSESCYWLSQIEKHPSYDLFQEKFGDATALDGGHNELLMVSKDSVWMSEASQLSNFNSHLFGLPSYAFSTVLLKDFRLWYETMPSLSYDSTRTTLPICRVEGILNHASVVTLFMEAMQNKNKVDWHGELNICFQLTSCGPKDDHRLCTNGRIMSVDYYDQYDLGYDVIDILQHH